MKTLLMSLVIFFTTSALGQQFKPCVIIKNCIPPVTLTYRTAIVPFNGTVRFSHMDSDGFWVWLKVSEPSSPCSPAKIAKGKPDNDGCNAKVGEHLYRTMPFILVSP